jgi:bacillithiol biosynthesis deacetylase BshB1
MKLDILAFGAHPDDVELSCSGTMLSHMAMGKTCGIVDLTRGELGTRGSAALRDKETIAASKILGIKERMNLGMKDGFFKKDEKHLVKVIEVLRYFQPEIVLCNAENDRHVDHGRAADLVHEACFLSGLRKISTSFKGKPQQAWRPKAVYHYIQDYYTTPDLVIDITPYFEKKMNSVMAYSSQFYNPKSKEPVTAISSSEYLEYLKSRALHFGRHIQKTYAEGYTVKRPIGANNLFDLL